MAGYLGLARSRNLLAMCAKERSDKGPLDEFAQQWRTSFGVATTKAEGQAISWQLKALLAFLFKWKSANEVTTKAAFETSIKTLTLPLSPDDFPINNQIHGFMTMAILLYKISKAHPEIAPFAGTPNYVDEAFTVAGLHAEDWTRLFQFARYYHGPYSRYIREQEAAATSSRPRDEPARLVYYVTDDDISGRPADEDAQQLADDVGLLEARDRLRAGDVELDESDDALIAGANALELTLIDKTKNPARG